MRVWGVFDAFFVRRDSEGFYVFVFGLFIRLRRRGVRILEGLGGFVFRLFFSLLVFKAYGFLGEWFFR